MLTTQPYFPNEPANLSDLFGKFHGGITRKDIFARLQSAGTRGPRSGRGGPCAPSYAGNLCGAPGGLLPGGGGTALHAFPVLGYFDCGIPNVAIACSIVSVSSGSSQAGETTDVIRFDCIRSSNVPPLTMAFSTSRERKVSAPEESTVRRRVAVVWRALSQ